MCAVLSAPSVLLQRKIAMCATSHQTQVRPMTILSHVAITARISIKTADTAL